LKLEKNQAFVAEVKRQKKNFKPDLFAAKVKHLKHKVLAKYNIEIGFLSLEDMEIIITHPLNPGQNKY
jgi:uncharacterized protein